MNETRDHKMRISILGTGDLTKIPRSIGMQEKELRKLIEDTAKLIAKKGHEIVIIPDRGIPTEFAKIYKKYNGKKIYGLVPVKDTQYGTRHIEPYLHLIDERIEKNSWYDVDGEIAAAGDLCIVFGLSPGIMREITVLKYHYKYLGKKTKVIWFRNTLREEIPKEISEEIPIIYINSVEELSNLLK